MVGPQDIANAVVQAVNGANFNGDELQITVGVNGWSSEGVQAFIDYTVQHVETEKLKLSGVRTDTVTFEKFGIPLNRNNAGTYKSIPVVITGVDFDTVVLVFRPA